MTIKARRRRRFFSYFKKVKKKTLLFTEGNMGRAINLSQKLGLRLTPRFYYGEGSSVLTKTVIMYIFP